MTQSSLRLVESSSMDKDKSKALDAALSQIERAFGKGSIMRLGKSQKPIEIETISTGCWFLPSRMIEPLPKARSIWESAASIAFDLSLSMDPLSTSLSVDSDMILILMARAG